MTNGELNRWFHSKWAIAFVIYLCLLLIIAACAYLQLIPAAFRSISASTLSHFVLLGVASYLSYLAIYRQTIWVWKTALPIGPLLVSALALTNEGVKLLLPHHTASVADLAASLSGILLFYRLAKAQFR